MPKIMGSSLAEHRERTRTALFDALSELMTKRSFDKITLCAEWRASCRERV